MARPCRADSQRQVFNTIEVLHTNIQTPSSQHSNLLKKYKQICLTFQTRDQSHAPELTLTSSMVCKSFKFVMDCAFLEFMCFVKLKEALQKSLKKKPILKIYAKKCEWKLIFVVL